MSCWSTSVTLSGTVSFLGANIILCGNGAYLVYQFVTSLCLSLFFRVDTCDMLALESWFFCTLYKCVWIKWLVSGNPWVEKVFCSFFLVASNGVRVTNSASGYRRYWSVISKACCLLGTSPQKSVSTPVHGLAGKVVILAGSVFFCLDIVINLKVHAWPPGLSCSKLG